MTRALIRDSTIYGLGTVVARSVNFLLLPVYTRYLDVAEYGTLALLNLILQNVSFICLFGVSVAAMRFYFDEGADKEYRSRVYGTATTLLLVLPALVLLALGPLIWLLTTRFLTSVPFMPLIFAMLLTGLATPMQRLMAGLLRAERRPLAFVAFNLGFFLVQSLAIVFALVGLRRGLEGQVYSQLFANALFGCIALAVLWQFSPPALSRPMAERMLRYGIPLVPFFIFLWINEASGRFLLEKFGDLRLVGIFALASQFAGVLSLIATSLENAMGPHFFERAGVPDGPRELGLLITRYLALFGLLGLAVIVGAPPVIRFMANPDYHGAIPYVAPLVLASWLQVAGQPLTWSLGYSRRTGALSITRGITTGVLIGLLLLFLGPLALGINGVILAIILAHAFCATAQFLIAQRAYPLEVPWRRLVPIGIALLAGGAALAGLGSDALDLPRLGLQLAVFTFVVLLTKRLAGIHNLARLWRPGP